MDNGMMIGEAVGAGVKVGLLLVFGAASILLPASYMMNTYAHHSLPMRLFVGILGGVGSWALLFVHAWLVGFKRAPYKTVFPIAQIYPEGESGPLSIFNFVEKAGAFQKALASYTVAADPGSTKTFEVGGASFTVQPGVVNTGLLEAFREAGAIEEYGAWKKTVDALSPAAAHMLGPRLSSGSRP